MADIGTTMWKEWAETFFIIILILGFALVISISSPLFNYLINFLFWMMDLKTAFTRKGKRYYFPKKLIIIGFFLGYVIGSSFRFNKYVIMITFIIGAYLGYYIHKKGYIKI